MRPKPHWLANGALRATAYVALAALVLGLLVGYLAGHLHARAKGRPVAATTKAPAVAAQAGWPAIVATGRRCAVQRGKTLQLRIEILY